MCFNALISNTDDHPRNHALIAKDKDWKLSPAYDLTPIQRDAMNAVSKGCTVRSTAVMPADTPRYCV